MSYLDSNVWKHISRTVNDSFMDPDKYAYLYQVDRKNALQAMSLFADMKDRAALGDKKARQNIVDYYMRILEDLSNGVMSSFIDKAVNFDDILANSNEIIFELLIANISLGTIIDKYEIRDSFTSDRLREIAICENGFMERYQDKKEQLLFIATLIYSTGYGQDCIEALQYQDINEIGILNKDYVYVTYKGNKIRLPFLSFESSTTIVNIQKKTTQNSALNYDMQNPIVVTAKHNSSRISVAGYDVTPSADDFYYNERIFNVEVVTLEVLRDKYQTISSIMYKLFMLNQKGRGSFIVSGSDMGVGKSTFLLSMIGKYPDHWGIGILDQQNELQAGVKYPHKNVITLVENNKKNLAQSFAYLLKTSRDVMVVSEITLPDEVSELVNAALRLNAGVSATMHSLSPKEVIPNLRNLMMKTIMYSDKATAEEDLANSLDLIVHLKRLSNGRIVVDSIHEVIRNEVSEEDLYMSDPNKENLFYRLAAKYLFDMLMGHRYTLRPIIEFDNDKEDWVCINRPSEKYISKMMRYAGADMVRQVMEDEAWIK